MTVRPRDLLDRAGWALTRALRWIGAVFITISLLGAAAAVIEGNWDLVRALALNALFLTVAFIWAIAVGTWVFAPRFRSSPSRGSAPAVTLSPRRDTRRP